MKFYGVGVGPGDPELVTLKALKVLREADGVFIPLSARGRESVAGAIMAAHLERETIPLLFPMVKDGSERDGVLREELRRTRPLWEGASTLAMPVIGDSALYATAAYLYDILREEVAGLGLELVPGVSAHSLASSRAGRFLALGDENLSVISGASPVQRVEAMLSASDGAVIYKPSALGGDLRRAVEASGPWMSVVRVDRAGMEDERVVTGDEALDPTDEYLSLVQLLRSR